MLHVVTLYNEIKKTPGEVRLAQKLGFCSASIALSLSIALSVQQSPTSSYEKKQKWYLFSFKICTFLLFFENCYD